MGCGVDAFQRAQFRGQREFGVLPLDGGQCPQRFPVVAGLGERASCAWSSVRPVTLTLSQLRSLYRQPLLAGPLAHHAVQQGATSLSLCQPLPRLGARVSPRRVTRTLTWRQRKWGLVRNACGIGGGHAVILG